MSFRQRRIVVSAALLLSVATLAPAQVKFQPPPNLPKGMQKVEGRYHTLFHDLTEEEAYEAVLRMDAMTEEYLQRTRAFSGRLQGKMPFVLFRHASDYHAAGGMPGSAGVYIDGRCLMAIVGEKFTPDTWSTIQHEGFHEFAAAVINRNMPIWVNEGLAEYFGEAVFTGDGFVSGTLPAGRVKRIQEAFKAGRFRGVEAMMRLSHESWNRGLSIENYDQAWAMTMFLAHGDDGKYQKAFGNFMVQINRNAPWERAWAESFGTAKGFEERWEAWWMAQQSEASVPGYAQATTQMLTSYLARATTQKQAFKDVDELVKAIGERQVKWHKQDVLPPTLADSCQQLHAALTKAGCTFAIQTKGTGPAAAVPTGVTCTMKDGTTITATFKLNGPRVKSVESKVEKAKAPAK